jgi:hypothetical protein
MEIRREEFPVALQAYDVRGESEDFVAEQVVSSQGEADNFMSLYAGRLIKTRDLKPVETRRYEHQGAAAVPHRRAGVSPWLVFFLVLVILVIVGLATGWIQTMIGQAGK